MVENKVKIDLSEDAEIQQKVAVIWERIFSASNRVLSQAATYGFSGMGKIPSPNIHEMLVSLKIFSAIIDILITDSTASGVKYEEVRLLLNGKEQVTRMERLARALEANNRPDYDAALHQLECQAAF